MNINYLFFYVLWLRGTGPGKHEILIFQSCLRCLMAFIVKHILDHVNNVLLTFGRHLDYNYSYRLYIVAAPADTPIFLASRSGLLARAVKSNLCSGPTRSIEVGMQNTPRSSLSLNISGSWSSLSKYLTLITRSPCSNPSPDTGHSNVIFSGTTQDLLTGLASQNL